MCELRSLGHEQDAARLRYRVVQARTADEWQGLEPQPAIVAPNAQHRLVPIVGAKDQGDCLTLRQRPHGAATGAPANG